LIKPNDEQDGCLAFSSAISFSPSCFHPTNQPLRFLSFFLFADIIRILLLFYCSSQPKTILTSRLEKQPVYFYKQPVLLVNIKKHATLQEAKTKITHLSHCHYRRCLMSIVKSTAAMDGAQKVKGVRVRLRNKG